jgi:hypothetical protein
MRLAKKENSRPEAPPLPLSTRRPLKPVLGFFGLTQVFLSFADQCAGGVFVPHLSHSNRS